jgi:hypothetical protein
MDSKERVYIQLKHYEVMEQALKRITALDPGLWLTSKRIAEDVLEGITMANEMGGGVIYSPTPLAPFLKWTEDGGERW